MKEDKGGWSRAQATVKLVGRRKKLLEEIARDHAPGCSPVEALDRVLELATAGCRASTDAAAFESLEDLIAAADEARRADTVRIELAIEKLGGHLDRLHTLIAELAADAS